MALILFLEVFLQLVVVLEPLELGSPLIVGVLAVAVAMVQVLLAVQELPGKVMLVQVGQVAVMDGKQVAAVAQALLVLRHFIEQVEIMAIQVAVELE
jgi:hypothetical protein